MRWFGARDILPTKFALFEPLLAGIKMRPGGSA
jgi:hypothetical protein